MTWAEFKKSLEDKGVRDDDKVSYIECHPEFRIPKVMRWADGSFYAWDGKSNDQEETGKD
jgi:hypothetical protein